MDGDKNKVGGGGVSVPFVTTQRTDFQDGLISGEFTDRHISLVENLGDFSIIWDLERAEQ